MHSMKPAPAYEYPDLFQVGSVTLPYVPFVGGVRSNGHEFGHKAVVCRQSDAPYRLPPEFALFPAHAERPNEPKCGLLDFTRQPSPPALELVFRRVTYADFLRSGHHLDEALDHTATTYRQAFAQPLRADAFRQWRTTNICGVGLYVLTADEQVVYARHSQRVAVNPGLCGFSASGSMDWQDRVDPFADAAREALEEINLSLAPAELSLVGLGLDTRKLYFQFSFATKVAAPAEEVLRRAAQAPHFHHEVAELRAAPLQPDAIAHLLRGTEWEPSAAAMLLQICAKRWSAKAISEVLTTVR